MQSSPAKTRANRTHLVVHHLDDDPVEIDKMHRALSTLRETCIYDVHSTTQINGFDRLTNQVEPDIVILDLNLGSIGLMGAKLCAQTRQRYSAATILIHSAHISPAIIHECLKAGADNFLDKTLNEKGLAAAVHETYRLSQIKKGYRAPPPHISSIAVGNTMLCIAAQLPHILSSAVSSVLITGESGTGKEIICDLVEALSPPKTPIIRINCGELVDSIAKGQLFGNVKGAYTGAGTDRMGLIESADGGWLFLDEVTSLPLSTQTSLLRVLENQEMRRIGGRVSRRLNVKVLAATNEHIPDLIDKGLFRKDLWQRLREAEFHLPPLRDRRDEIPVLINHFCQLMPNGPYTVSKPAENMLQNLNWRKGNIRELRNCLRMMTSFHVQGLLTPISIPDRFLTDNIEPSSCEPPPSAFSKLSSGASRFDLNYNRYADELLVRLARAAKEQETRISLRGMAVKLGISRATLTTRLRGAVSSGLLGVGEFSDITGLQAT